MVSASSSSPATARRPGATRVPHVCPITVRSRRRRGTYVEMRVIPAIGGPATSITACRGRPAVLDGHGGSTDTAGMHREIAIGAVRLSTDRPRIVAAGGQAELDALAAAEGRSEERRGGKESGH